MSHGISKGFIFSKPIVPAFMARNRTDSSESLQNYIQNLTNNDIRKLLMPVKDGLVTEESLLYLDTRNFSIERSTMQLTIREFISELDAGWRTWIYSGSCPVYPTALGTSLQDESSPKEVQEFVKSLNTQQKRSILKLVRDGLLTDECFINLEPNHEPGRINILMSQIVHEIQKLEDLDYKTNYKQNIFKRLLLARHYNSACFERSEKTDLEIRHMSSLRYTLSMWYTILFSLVTLGTFGSNIWVHATMHHELGASDSRTFPTILLIVSCLFVSLLMYFACYIVAFMWCCDNSLSNYGVRRKIRETGSLFAHFGNLHKYRARLMASKIVHFIILLYTMVVTLFMHSEKIPIYSALTCNVTNVFGLIFFLRIESFLRKCRKTMNGSAIAAR